MSEQFDNLNSNQGRPKPGPPLTGMPRPINPPRRNRLKLNTPNKLIIDFSQGNAADSSISPTTNGEASENPTAPTDNP